jgi:hypothetical protein
MLQFYFNSSRSTRSAHRKGPRTFLNVAFIYAGNDLLHTPVARAPSPALALQNLNHQAPAGILSLSRALGTFVILPSRIR